MHQIIKRRARLVIVAMMATILGPVACGRGTQVDAAPTAPAAAETRLNMSPDGAEHWTETDSLTRPANGPAPY